MPGLVTAQDKSNSTAANLKLKAQVDARDPPAKDRPVNAPFKRPPRPLEVVPPHRPASDSPAPAKTKPLVIVKKPSVSSISTPPSSFSSSIVVVSLADTKPLATQKSLKAKPSTISKPSVVDNKSIKSLPAITPTSSSPSTTTDSRPVKPTSGVPDESSTRATQTPVKSTSASPPASSPYPSIVVSSPEGPLLEAKAAPATTSLKDAKPSVASTPPTPPSTLVWNHLTHPGGPQTANGPPSVLATESNTEDRSVHPTSEMMKCRSYKLLRKNAPPPLVQFAASSNGPRAIPFRKGGTAPYALPPDHRAAPPTPIPEEIDAVSAASTEIPDDESNHSQDVNIDDKSDNLKRAFPSLFHVHRLLQNAEHPDQFRALVNQFMVLVDQVADIIETFPKSDDESALMTYEVHRYGVSFISDSLRSTMESIFSGKREYIAAQLHNPMNLSYTLLDYLEKYYSFAHPRPALVTNKELPPLPSETTGSDEGHSSSSDTASTKSSKCRKFWPSPKTLRSLGGSKNSLFTLRSKASTHTLPVPPERPAKPVIAFQCLAKEKEPPIFYQPRQSAIYLPSDPLYPKFDVDMPMLSGEAAALTADENGRIRSGTLCALVHVLTSNGCHVGSPFYNTFFVGFRLFSSPLEFFNELMRRYEQPLPLEERNQAQQRVAERENILIRTRVAKVVFDWLHSHWVHEEDDKVLDCMAQFIEKATNDGVLPQGTIDRLKSEVQKRQNGDYRIPEHKQIKWPPSMESVPECPVADFDFPEHYRTGSVYEHLMKFNTPLGRKEFAKQITARCSELFCNLKPLDDLMKLWYSNGINLTPPIVEMKNRFRAFLQFQCGLMLWVTDSVLRQNDSAGRAELIVFWLDVAGICCDHRDYYAFQSIVGGIAASPITRMRDTLMQVPVESKLQYWKYEEILQRRVLPYAKILDDGLSVPMVPLMVKHSENLKKEIQKVKKLTNEDGHDYKMIQLVIYEIIEKTTRELNLCLPIHFPKEINFQAWFLEQIGPFAQLTMRDPQEGLENVQTYCSQEQKRQGLYSQTVEANSVKFATLERMAWHFKLDEKGDVVDVFKPEEPPSTHTACKTHLVGTLIRSLKKSDAKKRVEPAVDEDPQGVGSISI